MFCKVPLRVMKVVGAICLQALSIHVMKEHKNGNVLTPEVEPSPGFRMVCDSSCSGAVSFLNEARLARRVHQEVVCPM